MNYETTQKDQEKIKHSAQHDRILRFIEHKDEFKFNIGDVLIKKSRVGYGDNQRYEAEKVSHTSDAPRKFLYFYENELGIGYIKPILSDGNPGIEVFPMTEYDADYVKFELDPEYAEHIILSDEGEAYDAAADHKRRKRFREKAYKANKKLLVPFITTEDRLIFLASLNIGEQFHMGSSMDLMVENKYEVVGISTIAPTDPWDLRRWTSTIQHEPIHAKYGWRRVSLKRISDSAPYEVNSENFYHAFVTRSTPSLLIEDCL